MQRRALKRSARTPKRASGAASTDNSVLVHVAEAHGPDFVAVGVVGSARVAAKAGLKALPKEANLTFS
jgi:hypothetical protein